MIPRDDRRQTMDRVFRDGRELKADPRRRAALKARRRHAKAIATIKGRA